MTRKRESDPGVLVEKIAHEACGSSDALAVYRRDDGTVSGYCWSCGKWEADPYGNSPPAQKRTAHMQHTGPTVMQVFGYLITDIPHRGIRQEVVNYFGVRTLRDTLTGQNVEKIYYPAVKRGTVVGYKERTVATKTFYGIGDTKHAELFGMMQALATGSRRLYVTEGEDDTMMLFQVLLDNNKGTKWESYLPAVVSLPSGAAGGQRSLSSPETQAALRNFSEIVMVMDNDVAGDTGLASAYHVLPLDKVKVVQLPLKDPCEMVKQGRTQELVKLVLWHGAAPKIATVATAREIKAEAKAPPVRGPSWPWESLTRITYGVRPEIIGVAAGVGVGKSSFWHQTQEHLIFTHDAKCGLFMLEEPNHTTLKKLAGKRVGVDFTNPDGEFTQEQLDKAIDLIPDELCIYRHKGTKDWDDVKLSIKHMVLVEGAKYVFVDPLTALVAHLTASEANDELNTIFGEIASMVEAMNFTFMYGAHLNPPKTGPSHEEGGRVTLAQLTGSKAMIKWSHYIIGLERNTQAEDYRERNTVLVRMLKDRDYGRTGMTFPLTYNEGTGRLLEPNGVVISTPQPAGQQPAY